MPTPGLLDSFRADKEYGKQSFSVYALCSRGFQGVCYEYRVVFYAVLS